MNKVLIILVFISVTHVQAQAPDSIWKRSLKKFESRDYNGVVEDMNIFLEKIRVFRKPYTTGV